MEHLVHCSGFAEHIDFKKHVSELLARQRVRQTREENKRVAWFAGAIAQLALNYRATHSSGFSDNLFPKWLITPNPQLANEKPAVVIWQKGQAGLRRVGKLMKRVMDEEAMEMNGK